MPSVVGGSLDLGPCPVGFLFWVFVAPATFLLTHDTLLVIKAGRPLVRGSCPVSTANQVCIWRFRLRNESGRASFAPKMESMADLLSYTLQGIRRFETGLRSAFNTIARSHQFPHQDGFSLLIYLESSLQLLEPLEHNIKALHPALAGIFRVCFDVHESRLIPFLLTRVTPLDRLKLSPECYYHIRK